jgi:hypothetical protein
MALQRPVTAAQALPDKAEGGLNFWVRRDNGKIERDTDKEKPKAPFWLWPDKNAKWVTFKPDGSESNKVRIWSTDWDPKDVPSASRRSGSRIFTGSDARNARWLAARLALRERSERVDLAALLAARAIGGHLASFATVGADGGGGASVAAEHGAARAEAARVPAAIARPVALGSDADRARRASRNALRRHRWGTEAARLARAADLVDALDLPTRAVAERSTVGSVDARVASGVGARVHGTIGARVATAIDAGRAGRASAAAGVATRTARAASAADAARAARAASAASAASAARATVRAAAGAAQSCGSGAGAATTAAGVVVATRSQAERAREDARHPTPDHRETSSDG